MRTNHLRRKIGDAKFISFLVLGMVFLTGVGFAFGSSEFDEDAPTYDSKASKPLTDADVQHRIEQEMKVVCENYQCKIGGSTNKGSGWTVSFNVGYGDNRMSAGSGGTSIIVGDYSNQEGDKLFASINVTYRNFNCRSSIEVPPAVYRMLETYHYNMVNSDGSVKRNFSPADQTSILFFTTILNKVSDCESRNQN